MKVVKIINKFKYAFLGLQYLWQREKSFRWQLFAAFFVQFIAYYWQLNKISWAFLTIVSIMVLTAEAFNTALERLFDIVEPRLSGQVALLKNLLAAAVLITALGAVIVAGLILL